MNQEYAATDTYGEAVAEVMQVVRFENWLRFYFIEELEDGNLKTSIPADRLAEIKDKYGEMAELAENMNGEAIDFEASCNNVCTHVAIHIDLAKYGNDIVSRVFDGFEIKKEQHLFGLWLQGHEEKFDATFTSFDDWEKEYAEWRVTDQVKAYAEDIDKKHKESLDQKRAAMAAEKSDNVH
jgi:hypothetical protein